MTFLHSLRWQLQIWHASLLILVLVGFGVTAYRIAWEESQRQIDRELQQHLASILRRGQPPPGFVGIPFGMPSGDRPDPPPRFDPNFDPSKGPPPIPDPQALMSELVARVEAEAAGSLFVVLWDQDGKVIAMSREAPQDVPIFQLAESDRTRDPQFRTRGEIREMAIPIPFAGGLVLGRSISEELSAMRQVALSLFGAGFAVLTLGLVGGWLLAARAIRPVEVIEETAAKIAKGDLSKRIQISDSKSELGRISQVLNSTFDRLQVMFQNQARFTSDAAHEFRTPLAVILAQVQSALARERTPQEYVKTLEACQRGAQRMKTLTGSLLELSRIEAGQEITPSGRADLAAVAAECIDLLTPISAKASVRIVKNLMAAPCQGDHVRLGQVVTNLVTNSLQFTKSGGTVWISTSVDGEFAQLVVRDDGLGIPEKDLPFIFERFYRSDSVRTGGGQNTGLGLAICKAIVQAHKGEIQASCGPLGTVFEVRIPKLVP